MTACVVFGLMAGTLLSAFRAVQIALLSQQALREGRCSSASRLRDYGTALRWALWSAACLVALALGGLWRVAQAVAR